MEYPLDVTANATEVLRQVSRVLIGKQKKGQSPKDLLCSAAKTILNTSQSGSQQLIHRQGPAQVQRGQTHVWTSTRRVGKGSFISSLPPMGVAEGTIAS